MKPNTLVAARQFAIINRFTKSHEWVSYNTDTKLARIGITHFAQKQLGDIVHVDMPNVGDKYYKNDQVVAVESTKTAADVYMMVDGEIQAINTQIEDECSVVNSDAQGNGWMIEVKCFEAQDLEDLLTEEQYKELTH